MDEDISSGPGNLYRISSLIRTGQNKQRISYFGMTKEENY